MTIKIVVKLIIRNPCDFVEGESELVSGFNVIYRKGGFALIFLAAIILIFITVINNIEVDIPCMFALL